MLRVKIALGVAATAASLFGGASAQASSVVCIDEPGVDRVYEGCTYIDSTQPCVAGGGTIAGRPYRIICP